MPCWATGKFRSDGGTSLTCGVTSLYHEPEYDTKAAFYEALHQTCTESTTNALPHPADPQALPSRAYNLSLVVMANTIVERCAGACAIGAHPLIFL